MFWEGCGVGEVGVGVWGFMGAGRSLRLIDGDVPRSAGGLHPHVF